MRIFSGIQPTSQLHIGNYLGAIKQWVDLQKKHNCIFCIVDLHSLTTDYEPKKLQQRILDVAIAYVASGLDPKKSIIFKQSDIKEHTELNWLLSTVTPVGDLMRMTQFKEKSAKNKKNINAGLLNYPVLMASDILLYQTNLVPVGIDQKQHIELTREIAKRFNKKFGETFAIPEPFIPKAGAKIMSLNDPSKKMSKSDSEQTYISLFDTEQSINKKIASATTDSGKEIKFDIKKKPGVSNLLTIYSLFSNKPIKQIENDFKGKGYKKFKQSLTELLIEKLKPFREQKQKLDASPQTIEAILANGAKQAQTIASQTIQKTKINMGLL